MANVHNYRPTAADIARVVRGEALARLSPGSGGDCAGLRTVPDCIGAAFATSGKDEPNGRSIPDAALIVLLAEAVVLQAAEIADLTRRLHAVEGLATELDSRTVGSIRMGPRPDHSVADERTLLAAAELKARLENDPAWKAAGEKLRTDLAERKRRRESGAEPHPTGGLGE